MHPDGNLKLDQGGWPLDPPCMWRYHSMFPHLHEEDAEGSAAKLGGHLPALIEQLQHKGGGGQRQRHTDDHRLIHRADGRQLRRRPKYLRSRGMASCS